MAEPDTEALRAEQIRRQRDEGARAGATEEPTEQRTHARRAERAGYLRAKLEDRAEAEERVGGEP